MSLTSHLKDSKSPVRRFFSERFPNTRSVIRECRSTITDAETIRPAIPVPWGTIGIALDYRLRYYFGITPSHDLVAWAGAKRVSDDEIWESVGIGSYAIKAGPNDPSLPRGTIESFFQDLDEVLPELRPAGRQLDRQQEETLTRYCIVLALFEEVFRAGPRPTSPLFTGEAKTTSSELLAIPETHWIDDICSLSSLFYARFGEALADPVILNPTFDGSKDLGGADGDFILNNCLIDIKATIKPGVTKPMLYQLLGYVLLDYSNQYQINDVGLYFARQGVLLQWSLQDLLGSLVNGVVPPLKELREQFQQVAQSANQESKARR